MGMENFWILTTIEAKIEEDHYHALSHTKPTLVQSPEYKALLACVAAQEEEWWNDIACHFLHPESCQSHGGILILQQEMVMEAQMYVWIYVVTFNFSLLHVAMAFYV